MPNSIQNDSTKINLAQYIDHTLLRPEATESEILKLCDEALTYGFKTVCIEAKWLSVAAPKLKGSKVIPITVISFPKGTDPTAKKFTDTAAAIELGAQEIDMVLNRDLLKAKDYAAVYKDISEVVRAAQGRPVKIILETSELNDSEKRIACALAKAAGVSFVKTSTGFSKSGATEDDVRLMREIVGNDLGVKASGGVRSYEDALKMIRAGATRLGTSASIAIVSVSGQGNQAASGNY